MKITVKNQKAYDSLFTFFKYLPIIFIGRTKIPICFEKNYYKKNKEKIWNDIAKMPHFIFIVTLYKENPIKKRKKLIYNFKYTNLPPTS